MNPDNQPSGRPHNTLIPQRSGQWTPPNNHRSEPQAAAANLVRGQIDRIYNGETVESTPQTTPVSATEQHIPEVYERTHESNATHISNDQWKQYHSAWQDYYQKYYERYYIGQVYQTQKALGTRVKEAASGPAVQFPQTAPEKPAPESLSRNEAVNELRSKLRDNIRTSAIKIRKSRHFIPITAALCVMVVFLFLQYNRVLFANVQAYISPGNIDPTNIIVNPTSDVPVSNDPRVIIPKINVDAPVVYDTAPDYDSQMKAMENGVAYFGIPGANSKPGQVGNTVLSGHSSNDVLDKGDYKFIFARLEKLETGDTIYVNYEGKRYAYSVTKKEVVRPDQVDRLVYPINKPVLTLITCTPVGTSQNRLLVTAEQISPSPTEATPAPDTATANQTTSIPGNSPTFLQRLFGGGEG